MKDLLHFCFFIISLNCFVSCDDPILEGPIDEFQHGCDESQIALMNECFVDRLITDDEIRTNLIGKWTLIDECSTISFGTSIQGIILDFKESSVVYENLITHQKDTLSWEYDENISNIIFNTNSESNPLLSPIDFMCDHFMIAEFGRTIQNDLGRAFLYEKIE